MADTFAKIAIDVRSALSVSTTYDTKFAQAVRRAAGLLLRNYNFPKSVVPAIYPALPNPTSSLQLDVDVGKIKAVRLSVVEDGETLYKLLRRRTPDVLPSGEDGPSFYAIVGETLHFDATLEEDDYTLEVWHQSTDPDANEGWMCNEYEDSLFHTGCMNGAPLAGKPELAQVWQPLVQRDEVSLAIFLNELEWADHDLRMGSSMVGTFEERYRAS